MTIDEMLKAAEHVSRCSPSSSADLITELAIAVRQMADENAALTSLIAENWNMRAVLRQLIAGRPGGVYFNKWEPLIFKALNEAPATDGILEVLRTEAIAAALDNCSEYCDGDCVMDSNGIGYEEAQLRAQGAVALNEALLRAARRLPESKVLAQVPTPLSAAITDIIAERQRQQSVEGWTPEHDDEHRTGELARAAVCYASHAGNPHNKNMVDYQKTFSPARWPWALSWWKPTNPRRDLVKAGALIAAEIERLDRATSGEVQSVSTEKKYCYRYVDGNDSEGRAIVMLWERVIIRETEKTFWHTDDMPNMDLEQLIRYRIGGPKERQKFNVKRCLKGADRSSYHYTKEEALKAFVYRKLYQLSSMTLTAETVRLCLSGLVSHGHITGEDGCHVTRFSKIITAPDCTLIAADEPGPEASTYNWGEY